MKQAHRPWESHSTAHSGWKHSFPHRGAWKRQSPPPPHPSFTLQRHKGTWCGLNASTLGNLFRKERHKQTHFLSNSLSLPLRLPFPLPVLPGHTDGTCGNMCTLHGALPVNRMQTAQTKNMYSALRALLWNQWLACFSVSTVPGLYKEWKFLFCCIVSSLANRAQCFLFTSLNTIFLSHGEKKNKGQYH